MHLQSQIPWDTGSHGGSSTRRIIIITSGAGSEQATAGKLVVVRGFFVVEKPCYFMQVVATLDHQAKEIAREIEALAFTVVLDTFFSVLTFLRTIMQR